MFSYFSIYKSPPNKHSKISYLFVRLHVIRNSSSYLYQSTLTISTTGIWSTGESACKLVAREACSKGLYRSYTNSWIVQLVPIVYCPHKKWISINVSDWFPWLGIIPRPRFCPVSCLPVILNAPPLEQVQNDKIASEKSPISSSYSLSMDIKRT
jgi:hypothetical protein